MARRWASVVPATRDRALLWGFLIALACIRAGHLDERDPYWQIRAGAENLAGVPLIRPDTWSWSAHGDWYPNSPLWNLLLALAFQAAGYAGLFVVGLATILALFVAVDLLARWLGARPLPGLLGMMAVFAASFPMLNARATLAVQLILLLSVALAVRLGERLAPVAPATGALVVFVVAAPISVLGNWVHLSFLVLGPALGCAWALVWWLTPGLRAVQRWLLSIGGIAGWTLGVLLSPYGLALGLERSQAVQEACRGLIVEWSSPLNPFVPRVFLVILAATLVLAAGGVWWVVRRLRAGRRDRGTRILVALVAAGAPAAAVGLAATRFLGVSLLVLAPVGAAAATRLVDLLRSRVGSRPATGVMAQRLREYTSGRFWRIVFWWTLVVLLPGVAILSAQLGAPPERALAQQLPGGCQLFARPSIGSAVILLRPDVPIWIDGRADFYGRELIERTYGYFLATSAETLPPGASCALIDTRDEAGTPFLQRLADDPGWRLVATDGSLQLWLPRG